MSRNICATRPMSIQFTPAELIFLRYVLDTYACQACFDPRATHTFVTIKVSNWHARKCRDILRSLTNKCN